MNERKIEMTYGREKGRGSQEKDKLGRKGGRQRTRNTKKEASTLKSGSKVSEDGKWEIR